jgi:hypothetical protein
VGAAGIDPAYALSRRRSLIWSARQAIEVEDATSNRRQGAGCPVSLRRPARLRDSPDRRTAVLNGSGVSVHAARGIKVTHTLFSIGEFVGGVGVGLESHRR